MEDVDNDIAHVDQRPLTLARAFGTDDLHAFVLELHFDLFGDRLNVAVARTRCDDQVVGVALLVAQIDDDDVFGFDIERDVGGSFGEGFSIQRNLP